MNILLVSDVLIPTFNIGIIRPFLALRNKGVVCIKLVKNSSLKSKDIDWCDVALFCRSQDENSYNSFLKIKKKNKKVIYDIDDNFFELPLELPLSYYHRDSKALFILKQFLRYSDVVTTYSEIMYNQAKKYNDNVILLNCYFDDAIINGIEQKVSSDKIKIAYATNRSSDSNLEDNLELALSKIAKEFGDRVEIHFWKEPFASLIGMKNVVRNMVEPNYERFLKKFHKNKFDIGLAPLLDDVFYNSKTNNKYREYSGCRVAGVFSNVKLYKSCINDGVNGLLVDNSSESWYMAIKRLILSRELREFISSNAKKDVLANYSFANSVQSWEEILNNIKHIKTISINDEIKCNLIYVYKKGNVPFTPSSYKLFNYIIGLKNGFSDFKLECQSYMDYLIENKALIYYVCNGIDDNNNLLDLSKHYKDVIVDANGFEIDTSDINKTYIIHSEEDVSIVTRGNKIYIPKDLSDDSRGVNTIKYVMSEVIYRYSIPSTAKYKYKLYQLKARELLIHFLFKITKFPSEFKNIYYRIVLAVRGRVMYSIEKIRLGI